MKINKTALYKHLNISLAKEYSFFKFGDKRIIRKYAEGLTKLIKSRIKDRKNLAIYTTGKPPITKFCKKNSLLLAEEIAKKLNLPIFIGEYKYRYDRNEFYDNSSDRLYRKIHKPIIKNLDRIQENNYHIIMIDDSILTGNSIKASIEQLKRVVKQITFFCIVDLKNKKMSERELNDYSYKEGGLPFLLKLLKTDDYIPTSHFIRTVEGLGKKDRTWLFKDLNIKQKSLLTKAYYIYTNRRLFRN